VLVVEDNPGDARLVRELLARDVAGAYDVAHARTVDEATQRLGKLHFDVILLDLSLPDGSGVDTVVRVYAAAPSVPIVVVSGFDDGSLIARAVEEGAQDYLIKGHMDERLLVHAIRFAMERQRLLNERYVSLSEVARLLSRQRIAALEAKVDRLVSLIGAQRDEAKG
jgi:DNA-binding NarL/FixJ family response regulator